MENFKIGNKLGDGAYSSVFEVTRIEDGKKYAMKKVKIKSMKQKDQ